MGGGFDRVDRTCFWLEGRERFVLCLGLGSGYCLRERILEEGRFGVGREGWIFYFLKDIF